MAMVEAQPTTQATLKRQRDETLDAQTLEIDPTNKHQKSYNDILSILDENEDEPEHDLSSLITTFQEELSNPSFHVSSFEANSENASEGYTSSSSSGSSSPTSSSFMKEEEEGDDDVERVMRHLLEASDDELGIPQRENGFEEVEGGDEFGFGGCDGLLVCDGLWELEDEAANYYALMQSELFM